MKKQTKKSIIIRKPKTVLKLEAKVIKDIFMLFLALNAVGYNDENNKKGMHPVRKKARNILQKYNWNQKYPYFKKIFKKTDPWYLIRAILKKHENIKRIKTPNNYFVLNLKKFAKEPLVKKTWKVLKDYHLKEAKKIFPLFKKETIRITTFINVPPKKLKKVVLVVSLLDAFWRGYGLKIQNTGYIVAGPGAEKNHGELIRHEVLHVLAPQYRIPSRFTSEKDHQRAVRLGYAGRSIIRREYIILGLNLIYESEILKKNISKAIKNEEKDFPHIRRVMEFIKRKIKGDHL